MRGEGYRVYVTGPGGHNDPLSNKVDVWTADPTGRILSNAGAWEDHVEGAAISAPTLSLPAEAMEAFIAAIERYQGAPSHARTESAVLREWLQAERARVDAILNR